MLGLVPKIPNHPNAVCSASRHRWNLDSSQTYDQLKRIMLWVVVHPIAGDNSSAMQAFVRRLTRETFADVEALFAAQAKRFGVSLKQPFTVRAGAILDKRPPAPPLDGNVLEVVWSSLNLHWWSWQVGREHGNTPAQVRVFMVLHDPKSNLRVGESLGLQKGLIVVTHSFAGRTPT